MLANPPAAGEEKNTARLGKWPEKNEGDAGEVWKVSRKRREFCGVAIGDLSVWEGEEGVMFSRERE